jgi:hypothetical protein
VIPVHINMNDVTSIDDIMRSEDTHINL